MYTKGRWSTLVTDIWVKQLETFKVLVLNKFLFGVQLQYVNENANVSTRVYGSQPHPKVELSLDLGTSCLSARVSKVFRRICSKVWDPFEIDSL
jgi:hypothetical protein